CGLALGYVRLQEQARAEFAPPTVFVTEPVSGASAPVGTHLVVSAAALGDTPVSRAELWVDGELVDTQECDLPEGISPFYAHFGLLVSEGPQQLFVRAVNIQGIIGQSPPVGVVGDSSPEEAFHAVLVASGETLADIAMARDIEPEVVEELNPDLGGQDPPAGAVVIVPTPPEEEAPPSVGPSVPPTAPDTTPSPPTPPGTGPVPMPGGPPLKVIEPQPIPMAPWLPLLAVPRFDPPAAPSGLQGQVEDCMVRLRWNDNANNETRYEVWMAPLAGSPQLIASLSPAKGGVAWFEFPAPQTGGLSFWVEAVNFIGSQPSNIVWVEVEHACPTRSPAQLEVEALDMSVRGNYDRVYCYVSFEKTPEERLPRDDSSFIQMQGDQGDIAAWASGSNKFVIPIPADAALDIAGECWGWSGDTLDKLGTFSDSTSANQWTGTRLPLAGEGYEIGYAVASASGDGGAGEETTYAYEDPTLPSPYNLTMLSKTIPGVPGSSSTSLYWDWNGDQKTITGFAVFLDGVPYKTVTGADKRGVQVHVPTMCGRTFRWQVAAVSGQAQSSFSASYDYHSEPCPVQVEVQFKELRILCSENYWFHWTCPNCGEVGTWWTLFANDQQRKSYYSNLRFVLKCGTYKISQIDMNEEDTLVVSISSSDPTLQVGSRFYYMNHYGEPRNFQYARRTITMPLEKWKTYDQEFELWTKASGVYSYLVVRVRRLEGGSIL
ncbi:MAG: hypothetical protein WBB22_04130, partial [Anaerolineae bacterium]